MNHNIINIKGAIHKTHHKYTVKENHSNVYKTKK